MNPLIEFLAGFQTLCGAWDCGPNDPSFDRNFPVALDHAFPEPDQLEEAILELPHEDLVSLPKKRRRTIPKLLWRLADFRSERVVERGLDRASDDPCFAMELLCVLGLGTDPGFDSQNTRRAENPSDARRGFEKRPRSAGP